MEQQTSRSNSINVSKNPSSEMFEWDYIVQVLIQVVSTFVSSQNVPFISLDLLHVSSMLHGKLLTLLLLLHISVGKVCNTFQICNIVRFFPFVTFLSFAAVNDIWVSKGCNRVHVTSLLLATSCSFNKI